MCHSRHKLTRAVAMSYREGFKHDINSAKQLQVAAGKTFPVFLAGGR